MSRPPVTWPLLKALSIQIPVTTADASPYHPKSVRLSKITHRKFLRIAECSGSARLNRVKPPPAFFPSFQGPLRRAPRRRPRRHLRSPPESLLPEPGGAPFP